MLTSCREVLDLHAGDCGGRVLALLLHPEDQDALAIVELWGIPVLGGDDVEKGRMALLCESAGVVLIPPFDSVEDLLDRWTYHHPDVLRGSAS
jgi:hypothetical protein